MTDLPLSHIDIIELSTMVAGPYAGQLLGDLGANVVKIERPGTGELARNLDPKVNDEESFYYLTANRNKQSLALDITSDDGRDTFLALADEADVILENFQPGFTDRYGIDYDTICDRNPEIIYCAISAYGETGPYRTKPGIDTTVQALSGAMSMARTEDSKPMRSGLPMNDVFASLYATQGILTALYNRDRTGSGEFIDVSLLDAATAGLTTRAMYSLVTNEPYPPFGRRHNYFAPEGTYEASNGDVQLSVVTDRHWEWFCDALALPDLKTDDRFTEVNTRVSNRHELDAILIEIFHDWTVTDLVETLQDAGVPAAPINDTLSVWDDPQVQAREMHQTIEHPTAGTIDAIGHPVKYTNINPQIRRHPPRLGEHTRDVLESLGYDDDTITEFIENNTVSTTDSEPTT